MPNPLATATAAAQLTNQPGRSIASARSHRWVVDSPPPLGGPNEEVNPLDALLSALATCAIFVCETVAREQGLGLAGARATVEADFDPRGIKGEDVNPKIQAFRLVLELDGVEEEGKAAELVAALQRRCPVYTTLVASAPIDVRIAPWGRRDG